MKKAFLFLFFTGLFFTSAHADIIMPGEKVVKLCNRIVNADDFDSVAAVVVGVESTGEGATYHVESGQCLEDIFEFNHYVIYVNGVLAMGPKIITSVVIKEDQSINTVISYEIMQTDEGYLLIRTGSSVPSEKAEPRQVTPDTPRRSVLTSVKNLHQEESLLPPLVTFDSEQIKISIASLIVFIGLAGLFNTPNRRRK